MHLANKLPYTSGDFKLNEEQIGNIDAWLREHTKTCPCFGGKTAGWFGSPLAYTFRPHGMGTETKVACNCGAELDVSEEII